MLNKRARFVERTAVVAQQIQQYETRRTCMTAFAKHQHTLPVVHMAMYDRGQRGVGRHDVEMARMHIA